MAVEDELVLAADEVAERDVGSVVARARDEHLLAVLGLADVEGRRGEVDEQRRAGEREIGRRRARLPDVLADRRADEHLAHLEQQELAPGREVAVLVEDAVVGQEVLAVDALDGAVRAHEGGVREVAVEGRAADERDGARRSPAQPRRPPRARPGRTRAAAAGPPADSPVTASSGRTTRSAPARLRLSDRLGDPRDVAVEIADDDVELRERDPHRRILSAAQEATARGFRLSVTNVTLPRWHGDGHDRTPLSRPAALRQRRLRGGAARLAPRRRRRGDAAPARRRSSVR